MDSPHRTPKIDRETIRRSDGGSHKTLPAMFVRSG
jgi:hypothetical protein